MLDVARKLCRSPLGMFKVLHCTFTDFEICVRFMELCNW